MHVGQITCITCLRIDLSLRWSCYQTDIFLQPLGLNRNIQHQSSTDFCGLVAINGILSGIYLAHDWTDNTYTNNHNPKPKFNPTPS